MNNIFIEDFFLQKYQILFSKKMLSKERQACENFWKLASEKSSFTKKQAKYLEYILKKYIKDDYEKLENIIYKRPFRILDETKQVWIEQDNFFKKNICLRFPFSFLKTFETEFLKTTQDGIHSSVWDNEKNCRILDFYNTDKFNIVDFINKHNFIKEESFIQLESQVKEITKCKDKILPSSIIINDQVILQNAKVSTIEIFNSTKLNEIDHDLFLAKIMGYPLVCNTQEINYFQKLVSSKNQFFWIQDIIKFFNILDKIKSKVGIILDRSEIDQNWLKNFIMISKQINTSKKITVCFRESNSTQYDFNTWIKENNLGGKVENSDILIFQHLLPKWIFSDLHNFRIMATNMINPSSNIKTQDFLCGFPCVFYLSKESPTKWRNKEIVSL